MDNGAAGGAGMAIFWIIYLVFIIIVIAGMWKVFSKAGQPGWAILIPIYNLIVLIQVAGRPIWWIILCLIPLINIIPTIILPFDIAKNFGRGVGTGFGLLFLPFVFYPILGFGSAQYSPQVSTV